MDPLQERFVEDLPRLEKVAQFRLRRLGEEAKEEATQEVIALCWQAYVRLIEQGRTLEDIQWLRQKVAEFAAKRVLCGRYLCGSSIRECLSLRGRTELRP